MNNRALKILEFSKVKDEIKRYASTKAAKDIIDDLVPYTNVYEVNRSLKETEEAFNSMVKKGPPPFYGLYDVRDYLIRIEKGGGVLATNLLKIAQMLRCSRGIKDYVNRKVEEESFPMLENICEGIVPLKYLEEEIFRIIVSDEEISDRASDTLYTIRRSLKDKNSSLKDKVNSLIKTYSKYLQENLYTVRGDRYVIPVKAEHKGMVPGLVHDQSSSGATLFIEPMGLVNLNNDIKELMLKEEAEIERILDELCFKIYEKIEVIKVNAQIIWEIDFIFSKAKYASEINAIKPKVNEDGSFNIIQGRHPLIDPKVVVPSDIYLGKDFTSIVITGPNTGGKTVTLKTVGLLHVMAMSGVMIPAAYNSSINFFDEVFADIGDEQSIEQSLSTFSSHMTNIVSIIKEANKGSLVLLDELGAGTDPTEGAALAMSILEDLKSKDVKIIATTHYSELKVYAINTKGVENASVEFDVKTLRPTYRLLIGIPGKSNAFEISRKLGLPDYIIQSSKELISKDSLEFEDLIESLQSKSVDADKFEREARLLKEESEKLKEKYEQKLQALETSKEKILEESKRKAKIALKDAKEEADAILKNIRELEKMGYSSKARQDIEEHRNKLAKELDKQSTTLIPKEHKGEKLVSVKLGEEVFVPSLNQNVIVLTNPDNKGEVQVEAGIMKINLKLEDLRKINNNKSSKERRNSKKQVNLNLKSVGASVDLRGQDSEEACYNADKYLDEAYLGGLGLVSLIHGKGTGVLRKAINDMLKRHPHVKNFRLGEYGEGGDGVTMVQLK
ncbi:endonuclease MutS2 [Clostridium algidicarnis]|uniref:Endonuclease MutS2 n=1 Tax=Clostridium algidicarnis TaxID=37659 RepID=A0ABS6C3Q7_9CLOT|nr:endonuclease MutS2 [Clostridium algidicarnis]MBB6630204.1 endonuclease MutS2 [Clostridium algidicarnis]MBU3192975.1 endonuclease MutS2 [Clostridium algidicarnis]MBU3203423.1 endonuclease MutS2 [Clostridium algidicarnis]MBU3211577.1 endonuclease MutS2 [Clostridium algidicarnis]MBU3220086.1 endonuclease MutS2 [Clostridium algidicarnis]